MGRRHVLALQALGIEVVGVCDPRADSLQLTEQECGVPERLHYNDPAQLLRDGRPDLVIISSTADSHAELTCIAARSGAQMVLCEKPMACSIRQCDEMIDACRTAGVRLSINHPMRFMNYYVEPKRITASPEFGGLKSMTVVGGNFGFAMNGTHYFEAFRYLTDEPIKTVTAWMSDERVPNPRGEQFEDRAGSIRATTQAGKRLHVDCSADQGHRINVVYAGPYGQVVVDELVSHIAVTTRKAEHRPLPTTRYGMPADDAARTLEPLDAVELSKSSIQALFDGQDFPTGEQARQAIRALVAAYVSHERGSIPVDVDGELPEDRLFPWA